MTPGKKRTEHHGKRASTERGLTTANKIDILLKHGAREGLPTSYRAIAQATGMPYNNIRKMHIGTNRNPGVNTLKVLADYFGVDLGYFDCETEAQCRDYLAGQHQAAALQGIAMRAEGLSEDGLAAIQQMIEHVRTVEGLDKEKKPKKSATTR
jgi:transcriptional regulator with XRE-family HTH domain